MTRASASGFPGGTGSSSHIGFTGSIAFAIWIAHVVLPVRLNAEVHVRPQFLAHDLHRAPDAPQVLQRQPSRVAVVARLPVFWVCPRGNPVTLELESGPAELLRLRLSHLRAPGLGIFGALHCRHRAVEADPVAKPSAQEVTRRRFEDSPWHVPFRPIDTGGSIAPAPREQAKFWGVLVDKSISLGAEV